MTKAKARVVQTKIPVLPNRESMSRFGDSQLTDESEYSNVLFSDCDLSEGEARFVIIECARLTQVRLTNCRLEKLRLADVRFEKCDLSNADFAKSKINRVELVDCKLTGFIAAGAQSADWLWQNCVGELVQLQGSKIKGSTFQHCRLPGADFRYCDLTGTIFDKCDLQNAIFYEANLSGVDFSGSQLMGIKAHPQDLKGAIIDSMQIVDLARHFAVLLGIEIKEI